MSWTRTIRLAKLGKSAKIGDHVLQDDGFKSLNHDIRSSVIFINFFFVEISYFFIYWIHYNTQFLEFSS